MPQSLRTQRALVLLSGGQDSTSCLWWALDQFGSVEAVSFDYGQRHVDLELRAARRIVARAEVKHHEVIPVASLSHLGGSALVEPEYPIDGEGPNGLPRTFVPGRNVLFLTIAAAHAYRRGISHLVTGVCQTDYSGYPDCRDATIKAIELAVSLGLDRPLTIHAPLMWLTKAETVELAERLPGCLAALAWSHTCYEGTYPPCSKCPACEIRARGFAEAGVPDPLLDRAKQEGLVPA